MSAYSPEQYVRANKLNAQLATSSEPQPTAEARELAKTMLDYVRDQVDDYEDFVRRIHISEEFSLTESMQLKKAEKELKVVYQRASGLLETVAEAAARGKRN